MRISDWSSDVCSSDLTSRRLRPPVRNALCNHRSGAFSGNRPRHPPLEHIDDTLILTNHRDRRLASRPNVRLRSEEHTSELQSLMRSSYAVFCLKKKTSHQKHQQNKQLLREYNMPITTHH